ncbi:MAG TPA: hypothetical protein VEA38_20355 [Terriglobales bacterium]|nr:hypothetical protein [Terriglobales bacterium]
MRSALLAFAAGVASSCATGGGRLATGEPVDVAGVMLPRSVGPYEIALVEYGGDPQQGAFVRYLPGDSASPLPRIDLVVYPADDLQLASEIGFTRDDILRADRASPQIDDTRLLAESRFPVAADSAYRAAWYLTMRDVPQHSLLYLHATRGRFLKARTSFALNDAFDPTADVDAVVATLFAAAR